jgi:hypothetical protein
VGVCNRAGVWMEPAVEMLHSVRIKLNSWCEVVKVQYESSLHGVYVDVYVFVRAGEIVLLSAGIRRGVYVADVRHMYTSSHKFFV